MPPIDYSRFNDIGASDSDEDPAEQRGPSAQKAEEDAALLAELPPDLSPELSLVLAAKHGQVNVVETLLDSKVTPNAVDPNGASALLRAVEGGVANRPCIELLLKRKASVETRSQAGDLPLSYAAEVGSKEVVEAFLAHGAPNKDIRGIAMASAARAGKMSIAKMLLDSQASLDSVDKEGKTMLHSCARSNDSSLLTDLLSRRACCNIQDNAGLTPITLAVKSGSAEAVSQLCEASADLERAGTDGRTALLTATESCNLPLALQMGTSLLEARADVQRADGAGRRPLPFAAALGNRELCELLLRYGAPIDGYGTAGGHGAHLSGVTALSIAASRGDAELVKVLLAANAATELLDERGCTPVITASRLGHAEVCKLLITARAVVDREQEDSGKTALLLAAGAGHLSVCEALLAAGANASKSSLTGATALHAAAANGHLEVCNMLLDVGSVPANLPGPLGGQTAAAVASASGHESLAEMLREREPKA